MIGAILAAAVGIWLMLSPWVLGYEGIAAKHDRIVGPVIATFGIIAITEACRPARWVNLPVGVWLLAAPWVLGFPTDATASSMIAGAAAAGLSFWKGKVEHHFGGGWSSLWRRNPAR